MRDSDLEPPARPLRSGALAVVAGFLWLLAWTSVSAVLLLRSSFYRFSAVSNVDGSLTRARVATVLATVAFVAGPLGIWLVRRTPFWLALTLTTVIGGVAFVWWAFVR